MANWICGPLEFRSADAPMCAGDRVDFHTHNFPHATLIIAGRFGYTKKVRGEVIATGEIGAGETLCVEANEEHEFVAMRDNSQYVCCFPHRNWAGEIVDTYVGNGQQSQ